MGIAYIFYIILNYNSVLFNNLIPTQVIYNNQCHIFNINRNNILNNYPHPSQQLSTKSTEDGTTWLPAVQVRYVPEDRACAILIQQSFVCHYLTDVKMQQPLTPHAHTTLVLLGLRGPRWWKVCTLPTVPANVQDHERRVWLCLYHA